MLEVKVGYVGVDRETGHPLVLLSDLEELRYLPIVIGAYEAGAILASLEGHSFSRPLTHDLLLNTINSLQGRLLQVVISTIEVEPFTLSCMSRLPAAWLRLIPEPVMR